MGQVGTEGSVNLNNPEMPIRLEWNDTRVIAKGAIIFYEEGDHLSVMCSCNFLSGPPFDCGK